MTDEADALLAALRQLALPGVTVGVLAIDSCHLATLHPAEAALVAGAVPARQHEFATGRALLHRLTGDAAPILRAPNGAPAPPAGTVLTLAHHRELAIAAVAETGRFAALGIDLERVDEEDDELRGAVLRPDEAELPAVAAFVIKEAAYKAWSGLGGPLIGFLDARVELDAGGGGFTVHFPDRRAVPGFAASAGDQWLALAAVPR